MSKRLPNNLFNNVNLTILQLPLLQQSCGLPVGEFPSMSSQQKDTLPAFPTLYLTEAADFLGQRHNKVTIGNYFKHLMMYCMATLLSILGFDFLLSIQKCAGVHYKQAESMLDNTLAMYSCHWMNFETWLGTKGNIFQPCAALCFHLVWHQAILV